MPCVSCAQRSRKALGRTPVRVRVREPWGTESRALVGEATRINYGARIAGDELLVWKADWLLAKHVLELIN